MDSATQSTGPGAFQLLLRVYLLQTWRRLVGVTRQSRLLTALIAGFVGGYLVVSFAIFHKGLSFANNFPGLGTLMTERLMFLMFAFLFVLLIISNLVIGYGNLFKNRETAWLLSLPVSTHLIFRWKLIESTVLASWAFLFLIAPLLAAYGLVREVPWHFYPVALGLLLMFVVLPGLAGSWAAVWLARFLDRRAFQVGLLCTIGLLAIGAPLFMQPEHFTDAELETRVMSILDDMLSNTRFVQFPLLPSYWLSAGVINWADRAFTAAGFFALVMASHILFFGLLSCTRMGPSFYEAASAVNSRGGVLGRWGWVKGLRDRRRAFEYPLGFLDRVVNRLWFLRTDERALVVKDLRMFWRDTSQWAQTLLLFGLLSVYILNIRQFTQQATNPFWVFLVSFLNLGACSLNLATLTTRFVFPQFSLEGKRMWIVGLAPMGLKRVVWTKFLLALVASVIVTLSLVWLSCHMLRLPASRTFYFSGAIVVMSVTLNALAVGLGALYPNFREENPSKIVSGFGGTFCLVLSFLYIVCSVALLGMGSPWRPTGGGVSLTYALVGNGGFVLLSLGLGGLPLWYALKRLRNFEI